MAPEVSAEFAGFPDFRSNVTFVPIQFFTIVVPFSSRGTVRIVGYALRKVLGWVDEHGNPTREQLRFSYRELMEHAGVSHTSIAAALQEAQSRNFLRCLEPPSPDRENEPARHGVYEILWDAEGRYTNKPEEFHGFYFPEAAVMEEPGSGGGVPRPKAARKNIPNAFFDYLLPRERLSVVRVVGAMLFYSIQWGPGGERKVPVSKSITELGRLAKMSRHHVHAAVMEARRRGYIEQVAPGCFDPDAGQASQAATYAIRWERSAVADRELRVQGHPTPPLQKGEREAIQSGVMREAPLQKGERTLAKKVNGDRSKKVNDISIKKDIKTMQTSAIGKSEHSDPKIPAAAESGYELLRKEGFDDRTAERLAARNPMEVIQRQIQWLALRTAPRNRLGFLRRAIEQDWPKPEGAEESGSCSATARLFASHYYAGYHGFTGTAGTEPFAKDLDLAAKFLPRLLAQEPDEALIPQWGQRLGRWMREKHKGDAKARPNLSFALVLFGDGFLRLLQGEVADRRRKALGEAREAHQRAFTSDYMAYLRQAEIELQRGNPAVYEDFAHKRERLHRLMSRGPFVAPAELLLRFDNEENRLLALAAFFEQHPNPPVLGFWAWDSRFNPRRFSAGLKTSILPPEIRP